MRCITKISIVWLVLLLTSFSVFASEFSKGQVWKIDSGFYQNTKMVVVKVEEHPVQKYVVHISVLGPIIGRKGIGVPALPHLPFTTEGLHTSSLVFVGTTITLPDGWREGYEYWNKEAVEGNAGIFTATLSEVIDIVFSQIGAVETQIMDPNDIALNEYVHEKLSDNLRKRIKVTTDIFEPIDGITFKQAVDLYKRDFNPEDNLVIWEEMARVFTVYCKTAVVKWLKKKRCIMHCC